MTLRQRLWAHRRCRKYEKTIRRIRQRIFDYEDAGKLEKAQRVLGKCIEACAEQRRRERQRAADDKLQRTPSAFEPGLAGS